VTVYTGSVLKSDLDRGVLDRFRSMPLWRPALVLGSLPGWLRAFVMINPVSVLVTTVRDLMHGTAAVSQVGWVLLASVAIVAVFAPLTLHLYRTRT
jgi:ABC-type multidrug transport system permease subunit